MNATLFVLALIYRIPRANKTVMALKQQRKAKKRGRRRSISPFSRSFAGASAPVYLKSQ
jgi:hypothetical protein